MSETKDFLQRVDLFSDLPDKMLEKVAEMCQTQNFPANVTIVERNTPPESFFLIQEGTVDIFTAPDPEVQNSANAAVITLGKGQSFGEMSLIDQGSRSATVKTATAAKLLTINCQQFRELCDADTNLGYHVMRNIAADLSFKLRHRNLI